MNTYLVYGIIFIVLLIAELVYFKIADKCNIIDKPNERSSHSTIVLRGGGIIFVISCWLWLGYQLVFNDVSIGECYPWFLAAVTIVAGVSFIDDIRSLPDTVRLVTQFVAMALMFYQLGLFDGFNTSSSIVDGIVLPLLIVVAALIVWVGASNIINFMDGINGITGAYAMASLVPLAILNANANLNANLNALNNLNPLNLNENLFESGTELMSNNGLSLGLGLCQDGLFTSQSLIYTVILADIVFCFFNFRPRGKAKCFAGDVGSLGVGFILLFLIGSLIMKTGDPTYLIFLVVYGFDGSLTICHRIMLHENIGEAHRKHAFQLMANELKMSHITVSLFYALLQLAISMVFIFVIPNTLTSHLLYLLCVSILLTLSYLLFMKKYYHLHREYLESLKKKG